VLRRGLAANIGTLGKLRAMLRGLAANIGTLGKLRAMLAADTHFDGDDKLADQ